jgi:hypothetical protein
VEQLEGLVWVAGEAYSGAFEADLRGTVAAEGGPW